jgi:LysM repeat protein
MIFFSIERSAFRGTHADKGTNLMRRTLLPLFILLATAPSLLSASRTPSHLSGEKERSYTVRSGDSLFTIAHRHHVTIRALRQANNLGEQDLLHPGEKLRIPSVKKASSTAKVFSKKTEKSDKKSTGKSSKKAVAKKSPSRTYKVQAGDTLSVIARQHGLTTRELREANHLGSDAMIRVGQTLALPRKAAVASSEKTGRKVAGSQKNKSRKTVKKAEKKTPKSTPPLYEVQSGDTLFSIARKYHTPLKDLMSLNKIAPTDVIHPGQKLKIPGVSYRAAASKTKPGKPKKNKIAKASKPVIYTVKHGDSLWAIAHKHGASIATIRQLNKLKPGQALRSGMKLVLKEGGKVQTTPHVKEKKKARIYTVKKGDTLWGIARKNKTTIAKLRELNHMDRKAVIRRGMKLTVGYTEAPQTRLAKKSKKSANRIAAKKSSRKKIRVARTGKVKTRRSRADRRIHDALAALNAKGGSRGSRGGDYNVIRIAKRYLGRRYVWGAEGPSTFDCSGFTQYVMRKSKGVRIPRVSRKQAYYGKYVSRRNLKPGDLIFFDTSRRRRGYVNHVGIYIGNNKFIHASSARHRVVITSLNRPFYRARFKWGRRIN